MSRIKLTDSVMDVMVKLTEGNPGALSALMELGEAALKIDPQSALASIQPITTLLRTSRRAD